MLRKTTFTGGDISSALTPASDNTLSVGTAAKRFANGYFTTVNSGTFTTPAASAMTHTADVADFGTNVAFTFNNTTALTGSTLLARFGSNASYKFQVEDNGALAVLGVASGSTAFTIPSGSRLNFGSALRYFHDDGSAIIAVGQVQATSFVATNIFGSLLQSIGSTLSLKGITTDGASAVGVILDNTNAFTTPGSKIVSVRTNASEKAFLDKDGQYENLGAGNGIILKSPDGTRYRLTIANGGTVSVAAA